MTASYGVSIVLIPHLCVYLCSGKIKLFADEVFHPSRFGFYRTRCIGITRTLVRGSSARGRGRLGLSTFSRSGFTFLYRPNFLYDGPTLIIESPNDD